MAGLGLVAIMIIGFAAFVSLIGVSSVFTLRGIDLAR